MSQPIWLPAISTLRSLLDEEVALVQGERYMPAMVVEVAGRIQGDREEVRISIITDEGQDLVLHLSPDRWDEVERVFPDSDFEYDPPIRLEWQRSPLPTLVAAPARRPRTRLSSLAG